MKNKSITTVFTICSALLLNFSLKTEVKAHVTGNELHNTHNFSLNLPSYEQTPYYQLPNNIQLPTPLTNTGDNQWVSFPAGEANQFQIVTLPATLNVQKPTVAGNTITETNLLGTGLSGFDEVLAGQFPPDSSRVPIINTISTQNHPITPYTYSPATVPVTTGPTPHIHYFDAEWFYVTEGEIDLWFGTPGAYAPGEIPGVNGVPLEDTYYYVHLTEGQMVYTPAGTLHSFRNNYNSRAEMLSIWYRQPNPAAPNVPVPIGGIEQFFTHPEIGVMFDSPEASEDFVLNLPQQDINTRLANWSQLFPDYSVVISSEFQQYLVGANNGTTNNPSDPSPNESVVFDYDPALLGSNADFLNSLWENTPELVVPDPTDVPESSNVLGILAIGALLGLMAKKQK